MPRIASLPAQHLDPALTERVRAYGSFADWTAVAGHKPEMTLAIFDLLAITRASSSLDPALVELASVTVSLVNQCAYCIHQHSAKALGLGMSQAQLDAILDEAPAGFSAAELAVIAYAKAVSRNVHSLRDRDLEGLSAFFDEAQIVELTWRIAFMNAFNRFKDALQIPPEGLGEQPVR
jgi:uncharacterized peroxidase-related enzyme